MAASTKTADREAAERLVWLYREHDLLWNPQHHLYANQHARELVLSKLAAAMGGGWTEFRVRQKLAALRASYSRERRKRDSMSGAGQFVSTWWLFNVLDDFLAPINKFNKIKNNVTSSPMDMVLDGVDADRAVEDIEDGSFLEEGVPAAQNDIDRLMRHVCTRTGSPEMQTSCSAASWATSPGPEESQTYTHDQPHTHIDSVRQVSSNCTKRKRHQTAVHLSERVANCAATVKQLGDRLLGSHRARDECDDFGTFVANYLRRISNADLRDEAMFEIHKVLRESARRQNSTS